jgi:hypothetical protein
VRLRDLLAAQAKAHPTTSSPAQPPAPGSRAGELLDAADPRPIQRASSFDAEDRRLETARKRSDLKMVKIVGYGALTAMALQIVAADAGFYLYGHAYSWRIPSEAIIGWLTTTVVQIVGVVLVITNYLFPSGGTRQRRRPSAS